MKSKPYELQGLEAQDALLVIAPYTGDDNETLDKAAADVATHEDIVARLRPVFGDAASITEQTDAWICLDLSAPDLVPLFERLCAVDLAAVPEGHATRTVIEHLGCYLIVHGRRAVRLLGPRSSAASLVHALQVAAASLG